MVIGFEERFYGPLTESEMVEVCLAVLSGAVGTVINVRYSSFDGTANSKWCVIFTYCMKDAACCNITYNIIYTYCMKDATCCLHI